MGPFLFLLAALLVACSDTPLPEEDSPPDTAKVDSSVRDAARPRDAAEIDARIPEDKPIVEDAAAIAARDAATTDAMTVLDASAEVDATVVLDAGHDPDPPGIDSEIASCKAMLGQYCRKAKQCGLIPSADECLRFNLSICPDVLFSAGSPRTIAQTRDCASKLPAMTCAEFYSTPRLCGAANGARVEGESCLFNSQCQGGCSVNGGQVCGQCYPWVAPGQACTAQRLCDPMHVCDGVCRPRVGPAVEAARLCAAHADCKTGELCDFPSSMVSSDPDAILGTCAAIPASGQPCTSNGACGPSAYCKSDRTCAPQAKVGQPCTTLASCEPSALCDANVCRARTATAGQECSGGCVPGTACNLVVGSATLRCFRLREAGQSCTDAFDQCPVSTQCDGKVCKPDGLQGLFEDACTP